MKRKILSIIITFCFTQLFSQQIHFWRFPSFLIDVNYEIIQDCYSVIYNENDKEYKTTDLKLKKGKIYSIW